MHIKDIVNCKHIIPRLHIVTNSLQYLKVLFISNDGISISLQMHVVDILLPSNYVVPLVTVMGTQLPTEFSIYTKCNYTLPQSY